MGQQLSKVCNCFKTSNKKTELEEPTSKYSKEEHRDKQAFSHKDSVVNFIHEEHSYNRKAKKNLHGKAQINPTDIYEYHNSEGNDINNITFRSSAKIKKQVRVPAFTIVPDNKPGSTISILTPKKKNSLTSEQNQDCYFDSGDEPELNSSKIMRELPNKISEIIGQGSFGRVLLGMNKDSGQQLAIKQVDITGIKLNKDDHRIKALEQEIEILSKLEHKNIVRYYGVQRNQEQLNIILEYVAGGSISGMIKKFGPFKENVVKIYMKEITEGLHYLHVNGVMHRDIKGANVLVDTNGRCKLADFGSSKRLGDLLQVQPENQHNSLYGTPNWMAPEVITQDQSGRKADIWSLGCVMIEMFTGQPPWGVFSNPFQAIYMISQMKGPPPYPDSLSDFAKDFLNKCLQTNPKLRWTAKKLLMHPFLMQRSSVKQLSITQHLKEKKSNQRTKIKQGRVGTSHLLEPIEKKEIVSNEDLTPEEYRNNKARKFDFYQSQHELSDFMPSFNSQILPVFGSFVNINISSRKSGGDLQMDTHIEPENKFEELHPSFIDEQQNIQKKLPQFSSQLIESERTVQEIDFADHKYRAFSPKINVFSPEKDKVFEKEFDIQDHFANSIEQEVVFMDPKDLHQCIKNKLIIFSKVYPNNCEKIVEASQESSEKQNKEMSNLNSLPDEPLAKIPQMRLKSLPAREHALSPTRQVSFQDRHNFFFSNSYKDELQNV